MTVWGLPNIWKLLGNNPEWLEHFSMQQVYAAGSMQQVYLAGKVFKTYILQQGIAWYITG